MPQPPPQRQALPYPELGDGNDLARLPATSREALLRRIGDPRGGTLIAQLARPENAPRLLGSLSGEELYTAATLAFITSAGPARLHEHLALRLGADGAVRAIDSLLRMGLIARSMYEPHVLWMMTTLQRALRPALAEVLAHEGHAPPLEAAEHDIAPRLFEDLALVTAIAGMQPKVTRSREVFKRDVVTLQEVFARRFHDAAVLTEEIDLLCELGLIAVGSRLEVPEEGVAAWSKLDRGEQLRRHAVARARNIPTLSSLWQLLLSCESVPLLTLVELAEIEATAQPMLWRRGNERRLDGPTRVDFLLLQPGVGLADVGRQRVVGLSHSLRRALKGESLNVPSEIVLPHLLPSLEAIVPPECPSHLVVDLGRFLELEAIDTVARFKLTRESVERASQRGLSTETMLQHLTEAAPHGVPDNVARAVRDFSGARPTAALWIEGPVVIVSDPARIAQLKADDELKGELTEVAPGVFEVVGRHAISSARRRLAALGLLAQRRDDDDGQRAYLSPWDPDRNVDALSWFGSPLRERQPHLARRARAAIELTSLGPQLPGATERLAQARAKLAADPEAYAKFIALLTEAERQELQPRLERILDPALPIADQLAVLDRVAPGWFTRVKARRRKTSSG